MIIEETTEVVVTIGPKPASTSKRYRDTAEGQLRTALEQLRKDRFEIDLYIRGSWRRMYGLRKVHVFVETKWETWRQQGDDLTGSVILPSGTWMPATGKTPPPEIVLRGVRRCG